MPPTAANLRHRQDPGPALHPPASQPHSPRGCPLLQISGIGKFPYLSLEQPSIDFGSVLVGKTVERSFRFGNHSVVDANFTLAHSGGSEDGVFTVTPTK